MGLDMYLYAARYVSGWKFPPATEPEDPLFVKISELVPVEVAAGSPSMELRITVAYWRKANAIHRWFVENAQSGQDDCDDYYVPRDQLETLRDLCAMILNWEDKNEQGALIERHLPPQAGFFFGDTEIGDWYFDTLEQTRDQLTKILDNPVLKDALLWTFYYRSSW